MDWFSTLFEISDMRSFSNLWYWITLAVLWSTTSRWVIGVPYDLVQRAARHEGQAQVDLEELVRIYTTRMLYIAATSGCYLLGFACAGITSLFLLGFVYGIEFAQALLLIAFPMTLVGVMSLNTAQIIQNRILAGPSLRDHLNLHRIQTQVIGILAIFITSLWGMYQNLLLHAWS